MSDVTKPFGLLRKISTPTSTRVNNDGPKIIENSRH